MDLAIGAVSRFPREVPVAWTHWLPRENGCNPGIAPRPVVVREDFDVILNRSVEYFAIPEHRCKRSSTELVFKEHELSCVSFASQISKVENPGRAFTSGIGLRNIVKIVRHKERNGKAVSIPGMLKEIGNFKGVPNCRLLQIDQRETSWPIPMISIHRVAAVRLAWMIDISQDLFGLLHPQNQGSWLPDGGTQIRRFDHHRIRRQESLHFWRELVLGWESRRYEARHRTAYENTARRHEGHLNRVANTQVLPMPGALNGNPECSRRG